MIIEYRIGYKNGPSCICCGEFKSLDHFKGFVKVEKNYERIVTNHKIIVKKES